MLEYLKYSLKNMAQRKVRTFLTLLGIVIGVSVIVSMVSIGDGMQASVEQQLNKMGGDKIQIFSGGGPSIVQTGPPTEAASFNEKELAAIKKITGVKQAVPEFWKGATLDYMNEKQEAMIIADTTEGIEIWRETGLFELDKGRFYQSSESGVAMLGHNAAYNLFEREINIGNDLKVNGKKFRVIGILKESGDIVADKGIYLPISVARNLFNTNEITAIFVVAENEEIVLTTSTRIEDLLKKLRGGKDFEIFTTIELAEQIGKITMIISFVLGGIASVSIIVGGIIVMNTMLMSVIERTKEIGIMKASGATNQIVLRIFLFESAIVGFIGGIAGIALGTTISKLIEIVGKEYLGANFMTLISKELVIGALLFSILVGSISGVYPAFRASKLNPVDALRYK
tara:strand:+ start:1135 stop:2331 length:1197 start_codon:yes stop_codon:yes gene_type:complete